MVTQSASTRYSGPDFAGGSLSTLAAIKPSEARGRLVWRCASGLGLTLALGFAAPAVQARPLDSLSGATSWINTPPLTADALKGKVVLVDFWTYSCINCLRELPYVEAWAAKYKSYGLVVIGVHAPEFAFEKNLDNIKKAVGRFHITFPIAVDNDRAIWNGFNNEYWPAAYFVGGDGKIQAHHFGEGDYAQSEHLIQTMLHENGAANVPDDLVHPDGKGEQSEADLSAIGSPETYIGYERANHFISTGGAVQDSANDYVVDSPPALNDWGLTGNWTIGPESARLNKPGGSILFHFHARDLHLVLGPSKPDMPVKFRVTIDGHAPGVMHGSDCDSEGMGMVTGQRLYQLVRQPDDAVSDHVFRIEFLSPGVDAFSFTFG
ncbi:redoxin family protein [Asaia krungthepensis]|uniref:Cytochrome c biogenesis protein n=1 Tax=Asaia krungthepensis NRIC 0535 TaxID=1307925 RepID=A0ABQ0PYV5_9PROT|nr:redoxin family protein [Asaia krungthepensis]GBQ85006.1 cytochrome c biogenesis protein [Asaia krungthepensis NRIC 0535]